MANVSDTNFGPLQAQATTNIFRNAYQQPENKLTYNFLTLLEHLELESSLKLSRLQGFPNACSGWPKRFSPLRRVERKSRRQHSADTWDR
jgi:hypothetical protein